MTIGEKQHLVTLATLGPAVPDGEGGWTQPLVPLNPPTWYVAISTPIPSDEQLAAGVAVQTTVVHKLTGRYRPDITIDTQVTFKGKRWYVNGLENVDELDKELVAICLEVLSGEQARHQGAGRSVRGAPDVAADDLG